jgi:hypothetical protein
VQSLGDDELAEWGVTFYEAMEVARDNLQAATISYTKIGDGFYLFMSGDTYDASRITIVEHTQRVEVNGELVALVPSRDSLFVTGLEDEAGLGTMVAMAEKPLQEPYSLSGVPLIFEGGAWQDWLPPEDHPLHRAFKQMEIKWLGPLYHEQKKTLEAIHEKQGIEIFVASYSAIEKKDGELLTFSEWPKGVDTLLPVTQTVVFLKGSCFAPVFADWSRVIEAFGDLMELTDEYPRRYRVREFPDEKVIDAIGSTELG